MKTVINMLGFLALSGLALSLGTPAYGSAPEYQPGKLVFKWDSTCSREGIDSLIAPIDGTIFDSIPYWPTYYISFLDSLPLSAALDSIRKSPCVIWTEAIQVVACATSDPLYDQQWYLEVHPSDWTRSPRRVILGGGQKGDRDDRPETQVFRGV